MENQIICPRCKKTITNDPLIDQAIKGEGASSSFLTCECGERITYWAITAQLRGQKGFLKRIQGWLQTFSKGRG